MAATPEPAGAGSSPPDAADTTKSMEDAADSIKIRATPVDWVQSNEENLIEEWGSEFVKFKQGNLSARHWKRIADAVNEKQGECPEYTVKQCQSKLDGLKKQNKKELKCKTSTGSVNSTWIHYGSMGGFLEKLPRTIGIPNAQDSSEQPANEYAAPNGDDPDGCEHPDFPSQQHLRDEQAGASNSPVTLEKGSASKSEKLEESTSLVPAGADSGKKFELISLSPASEVLAKTEKLGVSGQRVRPGKRKCDSDETMKPVAAAMDRFGAIYAQVATSMMQIQKDIAADKANRAKEMADEKARRDKEIADSKAANALALKEMEMRLMMALKTQGPT